MDRVMAIVALEAADDVSTFGGKAASLGAALRAGLPVPGGLGLGWQAVDRLAEASAAAVAALLTAPALPPGPFAVRSSAVGEDSGQASFAGQHLSKLNVHRSALLEAIREVWESARTDSARAYRTRQRLELEPRMGVVVQKLVEPLAAGVLFTRNPITGADERVIEAAWGLGEAVVSGAVVPDRFTLDARGTVIDTVRGHKDIQFLYAEDGVIEVPVEPALQQRACLTSAQLARLYELAERCQRVWGPALDLEWAVDGDGTLHLLQSRPITTHRAV
jgi:pyruvate,water dikinase